MAKKVSKVVPAKVAPKKVVAPKPVKVATPKPVKPAKAPKSSVKLISFAVQATIPTQQYGNIMPRIEVVADSIEEARATVMPVIEELYRIYGEKPRDGGKVAFESKITETVKEVAPVAPKPAQEPAPAPKAPETVSPSDSSVAAPEVAPVPSVSTPVAQKPEPVLKAEKAISLAMTDEAAKKIREQIVKSEKIAEGDKPALLELVDAKITDLESSIW